MKQGASLSLGERAGERVFLALLAPLILLLAACGAETSPTPLHLPGAPEPASAPAASPTPLPAAEGRIAFSKAHDIWLWEAGADQQLTSVGSVQNPAWSPDGTALAFDRASKNSADLWLLPYPNGPARPLASNAALRVDDNFWEMQPAWSPDGQALIYASDRGRVRTGTLDLAAWRMVLATRTRAQLSGANAYTGGIDYPNWRPASSSEVLYTSWTYLPNDPDSFGQLVLLDTQANKLWPLTERAETAMQASWSPDGRFLAFVRRLQRQDQIWLAPMPLQVDANTNLLDGATLLVAGTNAHPVWSPRGDAIAYIGLQDGTFDLFRQSLDGSMGPGAKPRQLTRGLRVDADSSISWMS